MVVLIVVHLFTKNKKGGKNMANKIRTSKTVAKKASSQLRSKATTKNTKSVAGSALRNRSK